MLLVIGVLVVLNAFAILLFTNSIILQYRSEILSIEEVQPSTQVLVFGGGMNADGTQSIMQMDRVTTGVSLYNSRKVTDIIMTGDDGENRQNEVDAMMAQAIQYGVPAERVTSDPHGYRTYESCWRARYVYGIKTAIVVSQDFHLPRIIYICRKMGVQVIGVSGNLREYGSVWAPGPREILARLKAWIQVEITKPLPRVVY